MKKFFIGVAIFFSIIFFVDVIYGYTCQTLIGNAKGGDYKLHTYINNEMKSDVLFMGSSRCMHHYVPDIFEDSLNMSCYNCGTDGMGIPFMYGRYKMITSRYKPKYIIYDVYLVYDLFVSKEFPNTRNLKWLKPFYDREGIDSIFWNIEETQKYKMMSNMYRYNSDLFRFVSDCVKPGRAYKKGYRPLFGEISPEYKRGEDSKKKPVVDSLKLYYWEKFISDTKKDGVNLVLIFSPFWGSTSIDSYGTIIYLAKKYNIPIINHYNDRDYIWRRDIFQEPFHLNDKGAMEYSKEVAGELVDLLKDV